jgi:adenylate cyclase
MNRKIIFIGLALLLCFLVIHPLSWWTKFYWIEVGELKTLDARYSIRGARPVPPELAVVTVDENSLAELYRLRRDAWPWDRSNWAKFIELLGDAGAKSIMMDFSFSTEESGDYDGDQRMAEAMKKYPIVTIGAYPVSESEYKSYHPAYRDEVQNNNRYWDFCYGTSEAELFPENSFYGYYKVIPPVPVISEHAGGIGLFEVGPPDVDGVFRTLSLVFEERHWYHQQSGPLLLIPPIAITGLATYEQASGNCLYDMKRHQIRIGPKTIPVDSRGFYTLNFYGPSPFRPEYNNSFSFIDVINQKIDLKKAFAEKLVAVGFGANAKGLYDLRPNPFNQNAPGVELHATIMGNVLEGRFMQRLNIWQNWFLLLFTGLLFLVCWAIRSYRGQMWSAVLIFAGFNLAGYLLFLNGIWMELFFPDLMMVIIFSSMTALRVYQEYKERQRVQNHFSRYMAPDVVKEILGCPELQRLGGTRKVITVFFADLKGFTSLSEALEPEQVVELLNEYLTVATKVILAHHGTLDKFIGDAVLAIFGAPLPQLDAAAQAVAAALEMQDKLSSLREQWSKEGRTFLLEAGIGIATGPALVGNIGSPDYMNFTVIGDTVNVAARLQAANRYLETKILITTETAQQLDESFVLRKLPPQQLKGKEEMLEIFEACGRKNSEEESHGTAKINLSTLTR